MALSGVHIAFGYCLPGSVGQNQPVTLLYNAVSSQDMTTAATSTIAAPGASSVQPTLSISASAPIFYAVGPNPDSSGVTTPRRYMDPANGREDIFVNAGDKFAWVFA